MTEDDDFFRGIVDVLDEGLYMVGPDRRLRYWNRGAERTTGFESRDVLGKRCCEEILCHVDGAGLSLCGRRCPLARTLDDGRPRETTAFLRHRDGHRVRTRLKTAAVRDRDGRIVGAVELFKDPATPPVARRRISALERMAYVDPLTGLANRRFTQVRLGQFLSEMQRYGRTFGAVLLDVDEFKRVNDTLGHRMGDRVLEMVAKTLASGSRPFDVVGRWGGDEFLVLVKNVDETQVGRVAEKLGRLVESSTVGAGGHTLRVTVSCGATVAGDGDTAEAVVDRADRLMYAHKRRRRDGPRGESPDDSLGLADGVGESRPVSNAG